MAHKGHKHVIAVAGTLQKLLSVPVIVDFPGREDSSAHEFNASLRQVASDCDVVVNLHGEVTEAELYELYRNADVFLCLSEHEGFGLPVFEAMRCGVPVVAWACSALKELLADHPLALPDFDIPAFAAAIMSLRDPQVREIVLAHQQIVLERYTPDVVEQQLLRVLHEDGKPLPPKSSSPSVARLGESIVERAIANYREECSLRYREFPVRVRAMPHDFSLDYVSLYDLETYDGMIELASTARFGADQQAAEAKEVIIKGSEFSHFGGAYQGDALCFQLPLGHERHIVFGPYVPVPKGRFEVRALIELDLDPCRGSLAIDVYSASHGILARKDYELRTDAAQGLSVEFENSTPRDVIEFRLLVRSLAKGPMKFRGVTVRRIASLQELVPAGLIELQYVPARMPDPMERPGPAGFFGKMFRRPDDVDAAHRAFRMADQARDQSQWDRAARLYEEGLQVLPDSFAHLIQLGNVLKEAGQGHASESAYLKAYRLQPADPELNLQMGHLYKSTGDLVRAEQKYLQALAGQTAVLNAFEELTALGAPLDRILSLLRDAPGREPAKASGP